jgi:5-methyltetrahydrofolate--homocysteine methyltransferase
MTAFESIYHNLSQTLLEGDVEASEALTAEALESQVNPLEIINQVMIPTLTQVGEKFQAGEFFIPELLMAGQAAQVISKRVEAAIVSVGQVTQAMGTIVIGTIQGDIHDIGKSIVATMMRAHGFKVVDLGRDVAPSAFVDAAEEHNADIVGMSSLMTTTRPMIANTINLFQEVGLRDKYRIVVGGGSVTPEWAQGIGADGSAKDAVAAVQLCKMLVNVSSN